MAAAETKDDFQFYMRFAKPLVLNLPSPKDRVLAAAWVQKLKDDHAGEEKLRTNYLKLLLFVLQKRKLFGPFVNNPAQFDELEEFPMPVKLRDIAKAWLEGEESHKRARLMEGLGAGDFPPLTTECSANMLEYVAAQDIPNFGVHAYYAISNEPINTWENIEKGIFPKGALSMVQKAGSTSGSLMSTAKRTRSRSRSRSRSRTGDDSDVTGKGGTIAQVSSKNVFSDRHFPGKSTPEKIQSPLGSPPPPDRSTPTWGSNLIGVGDPPSPEGLKFAPDADEDKEKPKETPSKLTPQKDTSVFSIPSKTADWDMSAASLPYKTPSPRKRLEFSDQPIERTPLEHIERPQITMPPPIEYDLSPIGSKPAQPLTYSPYVPKGDISDIFAEEPPSFLEDEDIMTTPQSTYGDPFADQPSLPYQTPEWDMSAPSVPYRSPDWNMSVASLPYRTPPYDPMKAAEAQYASLFDTTPVAASPIESTPAQPLTYPPYVPKGDIPGIFVEEPSSFLEDEDIIMTPQSTYQDPYADLPSLPYRTPDWDMSAPSVPYRSPDWDMSAASLPYRTPAYDPMKAAEAQYASLFDTPVAASSPKRARRKLTQAFQFDDEPLDQMELDDFSRMEKDFAEEDITQYTEDFSALEEWAEGPTQTPPKEIPMKKLPKREVQDFLTKGVKVSPEAQDIVDDAIHEMSINEDIERDAELEALYAEEAAAYPGRIPGMRTPPAFSKSARIREAGAHKRYPESQFGMAEPVDWRAAEEVMPYEKMPTSPKEDLRKKLRPRPFKEMFPGVDMPVDHMPIEDIELSLIEDEELVRSPKKRDLQKRLIDVMNEIERIGDEVPAMGGIGLTTPRRSPSPVRSPDKEDDELFFFAETPPSGMRMSPEDYLSPKSKAKAQWEQLQQETMPSPQREPSPSPVGFSTPEFLKEQRRAAESPRRVLFPAEEGTEEEPEPKMERPSTEKRRKKMRRERRKEGASVSTISTSEEETDDEREIVDQEVQELYKSLVEEEEEEFSTPGIYPLTPQGPSPFRHLTPPTPPPRITRQPKYVYKTPPRIKVTKEEFPDALEFEEEPSFVEPWMESPPTPPSPSIYYSPELLPLDDSPPLKEMLAAHEYTEDFFDPNRPHLRTHVMVKGRQMPVRRHSRAPPLSPILDMSDIYQPLPETPPRDEEFERYRTKISAVSPATPDKAPSRGICPRTSGEEPSEKKAVCKIPSKIKPPSARSKMKGARGKTPIFEDVKTPAREIPKGPQPPPAPKKSTTHRPFTRKSFVDPKQKELVGRVARLIADISSPPPGEFAGIEEMGGTDFDFSPPGEMVPLDEDLPEVTPPRRPSPLPEIQEFDFQSDIQDFMTPPSPRRPQEPEFYPFPYQGSPTTPSYLFGESPPQLYHSPPMEVAPEPSPEIEPPDPLLFVAEVLSADSPPYDATFTVRRGMGQFYPLSRRSPRPRHGKIYEVPETEEFEQHMPFHDKIASIPGPCITRRPVRAGTKRVPRHSVMPGLQTVHEHTDISYPQSPLTGRSPRSPPRMPPQRPRVTEDTEQLIDIPCGTCGAQKEATPPRRKRSRIRRKTSGRRIDFDAEPPSPQTPKRPVAQPAPYYDEYGTPPEDLFGEYYPTDDFKAERTIMDYTPPCSLPEPPLQPMPPPLRHFSPHKRAKIPEIPQKYQYKPKTPTRTTFDEESPFQFPESPEPLPDEIEDDFPVSTALPGFPPVSPFELPPSPKKVFGRQLTPEYKRRVPTMAARLVTPPRERRPPAPGLVAAHKQYQSLLMDTPPEAEGAAGVCPAAMPGPSTRRMPTPPRGPSKIIRKTSKTTISPRERRTETTITETSPITPPMMIMPPSRQDPFSTNIGVDLFGEEMPEHMELSPLEEMKRGMRAAPRRTTRRRVQLYGYGEKEPLVLQRGRHPPPLDAVTEAADEPRDDYEYWPGPFVPQVSKPPVVCPGGRLAPPVYRNVPPVSAKGLRTADYSRAIGFPIRQPTVRQPPANISLAQATPTRKRPPRHMMTARKRLDFEEPPTSYMEHLERLVADVPIPEDLDVPQLPPVAQIEFKSPEWSPVPITSLLPPERKMLDEIDIPEGFESPRTPKKSPELPYVEIDETIEEYSPPMEMAPTSPMSPLEDMSPPHGMEELEEFTPTSPVYSSPESPPGALRQRIREHQYTKHFGDAQKEHLSKYVHVKGRPHRVMKSQQPCLRPLEEEPEVLPKTPPYVQEEKFFEISPVSQDPMQDVLAKAAEQYASLFDSPEMEVMEQEQRPQIDEDIPLDLVWKLQPPITDPPIDRPILRPTYTPRGSPRMASPDKFKYGMAAQVHPADMLDYDDSPPLYHTPPRDIFAEAMEMEDEEEEDLEALLTGSPVRRSPPGSESNKVTTPESLDINLNFADNSLASSSHRNHTPRTIYTSEFNDLAYCIQKGLDYFPVRENDIPLTTTKAVACHTNALQEPKSTNTQLMNDVNKLLQPTQFGQFSQYIIAFYYYLNGDNDEEEKPLAKSTPRRSVNSPQSFRQRQTPPNFRRLSPPVPNASRNDSCGGTCNSMPTETIYQSAQDMDTIYQSARDSYSAMGSRSNVCLSTSGQDASLPLTVPKSQSFQRLSPIKPVNPQNYWASTFKTLPTSTLNSSRYARNTFDTLPNMTPYSGSSNVSRNTTRSGFVTLPNSSVNTTNDFATLSNRANFSHNTTDFATLPNTSQYTTCDFMTLPNASQNTTNDFATLPNRTNFSHNTTDFYTLPNTSQYTTCDFMTLPNASQNTTNDFATLPNRTNFSQNTSGFATLPNTTQCTTDNFATLPNSTYYSQNTTDFAKLPNATINSPSGFAILPNTTPNLTSSPCPVNVCVWVLNYLLENARNAPTQPQNESTLGGDQPNFRTSTPKTSIRYKTTNQLVELPQSMDNSITNFQTLPHETTLGSTMRYRPQSTRRPVNFEDTSKDFRTLPRETSLGRTMRYRPQSTTRSNCQSLRSDPTLESTIEACPQSTRIPSTPIRQAPWYETTYDFQTLPNQTSLGGSIRTSAQSSGFTNANRVREVPCRHPTQRYDTATNFQTLSNVKHVRAEDMSDYGDSPPLFHTPLRAIFAEAMEMENKEEEDLEALLTGSPVRRSPPGTESNKVTTPESLDINLNFADNSLASSSHRNHTPRTVYTSEFNDLAYCIQKGLDYFPVRENDIPLTITKAVACHTNALQEPKSTNTQLMYDVNKLLQPTQFGQFSQYVIAFYYYLNADDDEEDKPLATSTPRRPVNTPQSFRQRQTPPNFRRLSPAVPNASRNDSCGRTCNSMPMETIYQSAQDMDTIYQSARDSYSAMGSRSNVCLSTSGRDANLPLTLPKSQSFQRLSPIKPINPQNYWASTFKTLPTSTLNNSSRYARNTFDTLPNMTPYSGSSNVSRNTTRSGFVTLPNSSVNTTNDFATLSNRTNFLQNTTDFATLPNTSQYTTCDFMTLPNASKNTTNDFATLPNRTNFSHNTTDFDTLPNTSQYTTCDFMTLPNASQNTTNDFATLPNRTNFSQNTSGFATLPNTTQCTIDNFATLPNSTNYSQNTTDFAKLPNATINSTSPCPVNVCACVLNYLLENARNAPTQPQNESTLGGDQPKFRTSTPKTSIRYKTTNQLVELPQSMDNNMTNFQTLPHETTLGSTMRYRTQSTRRPLNFEDTSKDFRTLPRETSLGRTMRYRPQSTIRSNCQSLRNDSSLGSTIEACPQSTRIPGTPIRQAPWYETTYDFQTLPNQTPLGGSIRTSAQSSRFTNANRVREVPRRRPTPRYDTATNFQTLPNEESSGYSMINCPQSTRLSNTYNDMDMVPEQGRETSRRHPIPWDDTRTNFQTLPNDMSSRASSRSPTQRNTQTITRESPRRRPRPWDDTTADFQTLPNEESSGCSMSDCPQSTRNAYTEVDIETDQRGIPRRYPTTPQEYFQTLPNEMPCGMPPTSPTHTNRRTNTMGPPRSHLRPQDDTANDIQSLPYEESSGCSMSDCPQSTRLSNAYTEIDVQPDQVRDMSRRRPTTPRDDFQTLPNEMSSGMPPTSPTHTNRRTNTIEPPRNRLQTQDDTTNDFQTLPSEESSGCSMTDCPQSTRLSNAYTEIDAEPNQVRDMPRRRTTTSREDNQTQPNELSSRGLNRNSAHTNRWTNTREPPRRTPRPWDDTTSDFMTLPNETACVSQNVSTDVQSTRPDRTFRGDSSIPVANRPRNSSKSPYCASFLLERDSRNTTIDQYQLRDNVHPESFPSFDNERLNVSQAESVNSECDVNCYPECSETANSELSSNYPTSECDTSCCPADPDTPLPVRRRLFESPEIASDGKRDEPKRSKLQFHDSYPDSECDPSCCDSLFVSSRKSPSSYVHGTKYAPGLETGFEQYNKDDIDKISDHFGKLPSRTLTHPKSNKISTKSFSKDGFTHVILSACGPVYVTSIPESSNYMASMKFKPFTESTPEKKLSSVAPSANEETIGKNTVNTTGQHEEKDIQDDKQKDDETTGTTQPEHNQDVKNEERIEAEQPQGVPMQTINTVPAGTKEEGETIQIKEDDKKKDEGHITAIPLEQNEGNRTKQDGNEEGEVTLEDTENGRIVTNNADEVTEATREITQTSGINKDSKTNAFKTDDPATFRSHRIIDHSSSRSMTREVCDKNVCPKEKSSAHGVKENCVDCIGGNDAIEKPLVGERQSTKLNGASRNSLKAKKSQSSEESAKRGGAPCGSGPSGSPVSPDLMQRLKQHQLSEGFMDPRRPEAMKRIRSREKVVTLHRRAPSPPLERVREVPEQQILGPGPRGLMPPVYPTGTPPSAEAYDDDEYVSFLPRYQRPRPPAPHVPQSPVKTMQRPPPRRRIDFDSTPPSPDATPDKVTTTETITYEDPATGQPVTETTIKETVYKSPRAVPSSARTPEMTPARTPERMPTRTTARTPERTPTTPKRQSPCGIPCRPADLSPLDFEIEEPFGGHVSPNILDTSDIPEDVDSQEPFCWLNRR